LDKKFDSSSLPPALQRPASLRERAVFVPGKDLSRPDDGVFHATARRLRLDPQFEVLGPIVIAYAVPMVDGFTRE
jgi:hypothetical protein